MARCTDCAPPIARAHPLTALAAAVICCGGGVIHRCRPLASGAVRVYRPLAVFALLAVAIRVALMVTYATAVLVHNSGDSLRYLRIDPLRQARDALFSDPAAPAGYPIFLRVVREIWSALAFTIGIQHCLGVATGILFYAALRRIGVPRGFALAPALVVFFSGDQLFLEQALLTESLWAILIAGGLYALVRGLGDEVDERWLALGGLLVGASATVRSVAVPLVITVASWAAVALRAEVAGRIRAAVAVGLPAVVLICAYMAVANIAGGTPGYRDFAGFQLYGRVAQFADCTKFKPPGRTRLLCQTTPPEDRLGPNDELFGHASPVRNKAFNLQLPRDSALLGSFAQRAILHQPGAYLSAVLEEYARIIGLGHGRSGDGANPWQMRFDLPHLFTNPAGASTLNQIARLYRFDYTGVRAHALHGWARAWGTYQGLVRLHEGFVVVLLVLAFVGVGLATGPARAGAALFLSVAVTLYVVPPLIALWDVRYGVLPGELLVVAATVGAWTLWERRRPFRLGARAREMVRAGRGAPERLPMV